MPWDQMHQEFWTNAVTLSTPNSKDGNYSENWNSNIRPGFRTNIRIFGQQISKSLIFFKYFLFQDIDDGVDAYIYIFHVKLLHYVHQG